MTLQSGGLYFDTPHNSLTRVITVRMTLVIVILMVSIMNIHVLVSIRIFIFISLSCLKNLYELNSLQHGGHLGWYEV
jgi:hypothetical protein